MSAGKLCYIRMELYIEPGRKELEQKIFYNRNNPMDKCMGQKHVNRMNEADFNLKRANSNGQTTIFTCQIKIDI